MANLSNINNKLIVTDGGNLLVNATANLATYGGITIDNFSDPSIAMKTTGTSGWLWTQYITSTGTNNFSMGVNQSSPYWCVKAGAGMDSPHLVVDSSGDVGIGTITPDYKLEVESISDADLLSIKSTAIANNTQMRLGISGNDSVISGTGGSTGNLVFKTYGAERMRIDSVGRVTFGPDAQDIQIDPASTNSGNNLIYMRGNASNDKSSLQMNHFGYADYYIGVGHVGNGKFNIANDLTGNDFVIDTSGNVGIGTNSPGAKLEVKAADTPATTDYATKVIKANAPLVGGYTGTKIISLLGGYDGTIHAVDFGYGYDGTGYNIMLSTNDNTTGDPIERMRINSSGNVGISGDGIQIDRPDVGGGKPYVFWKSGGTTQASIYGASSGTGLRIFLSGGTAAFDNSISFTGIVQQNAQSVVLSNSAYANAAAVQAYATNTANVYPGYGFHKASTLGGFLYATSRTELRYRGDGGTDKVLLMADSDYEEGTWTPSITAASGNSATATYYNPVYTKVGRIVNVVVYIHTINIAAITSGTYIQITGFPFTAENYGDFTASYHSGGWSGGVIVGGYVQDGGNYAYLVRADGQEAQQTSTDLVMTRFMLNVTYQIT